MHPVASARSFLFVPASRPDRFRKAAESGADCVIVDLEDAVPHHEKAMARAAMDQGLQQFQPSQLARTVVRVNAEGTEWHADDLQALVTWCREGLGAVMVAKAESATSFKPARTTLGQAVNLIPLVESLAGLDALDQLTREPGVLRLAFGHLDFQLDLGMCCSVDEGELAPVRLQLVAASRRAQLQPPIDGVTTDARNVDRVRSQVSRSRALGFGAKLCIHPDQVAAVNEAFAPTPAELEWSRRVLDTQQVHGGKAFSLDGKMVDLPVIRMAQRTLNASRQAR